MPEEFSVEDLIGNVVDYTFKGRSQKAEIAAIAEGVGWTLVDPHDRTDELCCWNGPKSQHAHTSNTRAFTKAWPVVVEMLKKGHYRSSEAFKAGGYGGEEGCSGGLMCAFS